MTNLWKNEHYTAQVNYIFDKWIIEYDISKANISVLVDAGLIDEATYAELYSSERMVRQYRVGMMSKDPKIKNAITEGFRSARKSLCEQLGLEDCNILHIVKDSIFVVVGFRSGIPTPDEVKVSQHVTFTKRATYSSFLKLAPSVFFYFNYDYPTDSYIYKVRGISEEMQELHKDYFIKIICDILKARSANSVSVAYDTAKVWFSYLLNEPKEKTYPYLRMFNSSSMFEFVNMSDFSTFYADYLTPDSYSMVSPNYNTAILSCIGNYLLEDMMNRGRR